MGGGWYLEKCRKFEKTSGGRWSNPGRLTAWCHLSRFLSFAQRQAQSSHSQPAKLQPPTGTLGYTKSSVKSIKPVGADRFRDLPLLPRMLSYPNVVTIHPQPSPLPGSFCQGTYWRRHCLSPPGHSVFYRRPHLLSSTSHNHSLTESFPEQLLLRTKTELITPTFMRPQLCVCVLIHP